MKNIKKYNEFLNESYDSNIRAQLNKMGITDPEELDRQIELAKRGHLGAYLSEKGENFTFGILKAIFKDAIEIKKRTNIKRGIFNALPSFIPLAFAPFFPILAVVGSIFGASRMFHRVFDPLFDYLDPNTKYSHFLKRMVDIYMKIPEGEVEFKDRFTRAFVVSDGFIDIIKPEILDNFSTYISKKIENMDENDAVPKHFIENELKSYLNNKYKIFPPIVLNQQFD
jgi:hypothetical protein